MKPPPPSKSTSKQEPPIPHSHADNRREEEETESLRTEWKQIYTQSLPTLARSKHTSQKHWPVSLDHCFARIILDNTLGATPAARSEHQQQPQQQQSSSTQTYQTLLQGGDEGTSSSSPPKTTLVPWDTVLARPAVRNMTASQLRAAIALGGDIVAGRVDLRRLDEASLKGRGKWAGKYGGGDGGDAEKGKGKRRREREAEHEGSAKVVVMKKKTKKQAVLQFDNMMGPSERKQTPSAPKRDVGKDLATLKRIRADLSLTSFRRRLYTSLLSVPCGRYTTYAALAKHLHFIPRAVGNGMRNNPFAPDVPCHRVLASDGTIGGFGGDWSRDKGVGMTEKQKEKMSLLRAEGVKFDGMGKVMGAVWEGFWDEEGFERNFDEVTSRVE